MAQANRQQNALNPFSFFQNQQQMMRQNSGMLTGMMQPFFSLTREFDDMFNSFFRNATTATQNAALLNMMPRIDFEEADNQYLIHADIPGLDANEIELEVANNVLTIRGERESIQDNQQKRGKMHTIERTYGAFQRVVPLPDDCDENDIEANYVNGVLTVTIGRQQQYQQNQVKKIQVTANANARGQNSRQGQNQNQQNQTAAIQSSQNSQNASQPNAAAQQRPAQASSAGSKAA